MSHTCARTGQEEGWQGVVKEGCVRDKSLQQDPFTLEVEINEADKPWE